MLFHQLLQAYRLHYVLFIAAIATSKQSRWWTDLRIWLGIIWFCIGALAVTTLYFFGMYVRTSCLGLNFITDKLFRTHIYIPRFMMLLFSCNPCSIVLWSKNPHRFPYLALMFSLLGLILLYSIIMFCKGGDDWKVLSRPSFVIIY